MDANKPNPSLVDDLKHLPHDALIARILELENRNVSARQCHLEPAGPESDDRVHLFY
jgi:hypothetical protein